MARLLLELPDLPSPWKPRFYPAKLPTNKFLEHYAQRLNSVEINYTFRRMPSAATLESWVAATPAGFVFALKGHMRITHIMRLKNAAEATGVFLRAIDPCAGAAAGPILFQLPPQMRCDMEVLRTFLESCRTICAMPSNSGTRRGWWTRSTACWRRRNISLCVAEREKLEVPEVITADFVYYRLRKPEYTAEDVESIARARAGTAGQGKDLFLMFKHEETPDGALHAEEVLRKAAG